MAPSITPLRSAWQLVFTTTRTRRAFSHHDHVYVRNERFDSNSAGCQHNERHHMMRLTHWRESWESKRQRQSAQSLVSLHRASRPVPVVQVGYQRTHRLPLPRRILQPRACWSELPRRCFIRSSPPSFVRPTLFLAVLSTGCIQRRPVYSTQFPAGQR
ncbi:hypothetical protein DENSPDRAFT_514350 [Dentipellis sp. KUC8613]|nr:hypothetical protein DENSPDRAFT_514350 [Dentipellis sp. KUC8613]